MKAITITISFLLFVCSITSFAQTEFLSGEVLEVNEKGNELPLFGANIYWKGTTVGAISDEKGQFRIEKIPDNSFLIVSFIGYQNDTFNTKGRNYISIKKTSSVQLNEVSVTTKKKSTEISFINPLKVENISEKELTKAACCNLSESFETSPSVDVSFTDAVTGTRQIQMLGLAGPYAQITRENIPYVRGFASMYGLTFVPGTWVESLQLSKGTGSVVNGYENITGQINFELRKPEEAERLYVNGYFNEGGRVEGNVHIAHKLPGNKWSTAVLLHAKNNSIKWDRNKDGFLDEVLGTNLIALNRWKYIGSKGMRFQMGIKGVSMDNMSGQVDFDEKSDALTTNYWGMKLNIKRIEGWAKIGKVYDEMPWKSIGFQVASSYHKQDSYFGLNKYIAGQNSLYANFMYQSIFSNTNHNFRLGASFQYDDYNEQLNNSEFDRIESVPGAYFEYTFVHEDRFTAVAGIRTDYHNQYGIFITPKLNLRYAISDNTVFRASAGRGQRTANIIAENNGLLASSRELIILGDGSDKPYGLEAEVAWNYGINATHCFRIGTHEGTLSADFFRTDFVNQIVIDLDQNPQKAIFYNLDGPSYSNSFQVQLDYELIKRFDMRVAYRWFDVKTTFGESLLSKPLVANNRAFLNLAYATKNAWKFDYTFNWQGKKRIPFTGSNPIEYQLSDYSSDYIVMNAQISKSWKERFEVYLGMENLLNFRQDEPILAAEDPFGPYFDSSLVWGPIFGRMSYLGFRYKFL